MKTNFLLNVQICKGMPYSGFHCMYEQYILAEIRGLWATPG